MLYYSRTPPMHLWPEIERDLRREGCCTQADSPRRLFYGKPAVSLTQSGPRREEHLEAH